MEVKFRSFCFLCRCIIVKKTSGPTNCLSVKFCTKSSGLKAVSSGPVNDNVSSLSDTELSPFLNKDFANLLNPYFKPRTSFRSNYSFVADNSVAKDIASKILQNRDERTSIVEGNSGFGLLSFHFLQFDVPNIHIYDDSKLRHLCLDQLLQRYSDRLQNTSKNLFSPVWESATYSTTVQNIIERSDTVVGVVQNRSFFNFLVYFLLTNKAYRRMSAELFLVIGDPLKINLLSFKKRGGYFAHCMFNFIFDVKIIAEYPCTAFLPKVVDNNRMYLLKITKKPNMFKDMNEEDFDNYRLLIKILDSSKYNFVIQTLEKWVPECGPYLISKGISMNFQTCDLLAHESVTLFQLLKKLDGFSNILTVLRES